MGLLKRIVPADMAEIEGTSLWRITQALDTFNQFGIGVAVTVTAFVTGSMIGFLWDLFLKPLDYRALRERPARLFTEAQFRYQIALPVTLTIVVLGLDESLLFFFGLIVPLFLVAHGRGLWRQAKTEPLKADLGACICSVGGELVQPVWPDGFDGPVLPEE